MLVILEKKLNIFFFSQKTNKPENSAKEIQIKGREKHPEQN